MKLDIKRFRRILDRGTYIPAVDGVRFVAIMLVLLHHVFTRVMRRAGETYGDVRGTLLGDILSPGSMGVLVFFALSGYILYSGLARSITADTHFKPGYVKKYFVRRLTRIEPPYLIVMTALFIPLLLTGFVPTDGGASANTDIGLVESYLASFGYLHVLIFDALPRLNPPAWSLEVEVQFYAMAPLFALGVAHLGKKRREHAMLGLAAIAALWCLAVITPFAADRVVETRTLLRYLPFFLAGMLVAEIEQAPPRWWPQLRLADIGAVAAMIGLFAVQIGYGEKPGWHDLMITVCLVFFLNGALNGHFVKRLLSIGWVTVIGGMCYSIYLLHLGIFEAVAGKVTKIGLGAPIGIYFPLQFVLFTIAALIPSLLFYLAVERPCMNPRWPAELKARISGWTARAPRAGRAELERAD